MCIRVYVGANVPLREIDYRNLDQEFGVQCVDNQDVEHLTSKKYNYEIMTIGGCGCSFEGLNKNKYKTKKVNKRLKLLKDYLLEHSTNIEDLIVVSFWGYYDGQRIENKKIVVGHINCNTFRKTRICDIVQRFTLAKNH